MTSARMQCSDAVLYKDMSAISATCLAASAISALTSTIIRSALVSKLVMSSIVIDLALEGGSSESILGHGGTVGRRERAFRQQDRKESHMSEGMECRKTEIPIIVNLDKTTSSFR